MNTEKNKIEWSSIKVTGNMHVGDIYYKHIHADKDTFVIFILAMNQQNLHDIGDKNINTLNINYNRKLYITDNDDNCDGLDDFFSSSFNKQVPSDHYDKGSNGWKPFIHKSSTANNQSIEAIIDRIFKNRVTEVKCFHFDGDLVLDKLIENENDKNLFFEMLERAVFLIDPISLSHDLYREFFEEIYYSAEIGAVLATTCQFLPDNLKRFSNLLLKRMGYRWHRTWNKPSSLIYFKISEERDLEKNLLTACERLGYKISLDHFKNIDKDIPDTTKFIKQQTSQ